MNYKLLKTFIDQMSDEELMKPVQILHEEQYYNFYYRLKSVRYSWLDETEKKKFGTNQLILKLKEVDEE